MPYFRYGDGCDLFRAAEVVDELPVLKSSTMLREEMRQLTRGAPTQAGMDSRAERNDSDEYRVLEEVPSKPLVVEVIDDVEATSSRPPSPAETHPSTPRVTTGPCPARLRPLIPPANYGTVEKSTIFRSAFPQDRNLDFMETLGIRAILTLVDTAPSAAYVSFTAGYGIKRAHISIAPNKNGTAGTTTDSLCEALLFALNPMHWPLYIHCNHGRHRTGCVVACLRKLQRWPLAEIRDEYETYASPKARPDDLALIDAFDPAVVYAYAQDRGLLRIWHRQSRMDSLTDVYGLAAALPAHCSAAASLDADAPSSVSTTTDSNSDVMSLDLNEVAPRDGDRASTPTIVVSATPLRTPIDESGRAMADDDDATADTNGSGPALVCAGLGTPVPERSSTSSGNRAAVKSC